MQHFGEVVAEDLGSVPPFLRPSLERLGVPGYRVIRWEKEGDAYRDPTKWPAASVSTNDTHDTDGNADWYDGLTTEDRARLRALPGLGDLDPAKGFDDHVRDALLRAIYSASSTLSIVLFQDAFGTRERINVPGTVQEANWSYRTAMDLDALEGDNASSERLAALAAETGRSPSGGAALSSTSNDTPSP